MSSTRAPRILLVYYTYTRQSRRFIETMAEVFRSRGYEVDEAAIGFTDSRWAERFSRFPLRHALIRSLFRFTKKKTPVLRGF